MYSESQTLNLMSNIFERSYYPSHWIRTVVLNLLTFSVRGTPWCQQEVSRTPLNVVEL